MATCEACGSNMGFFSLASYCDVCVRTGKTRGSVEEKAAEEKASGEREDDAKAAALISSQRSAAIEEALSKSMREGLVASRLKVVYVEIDSLLDGEPMANAPDFYPVAEHLAHGWSIVAVIPRTYGEKLVNTTVPTILSASIVKSPVRVGETWGGAYSGAVIGAYILMTKAASQEPSLDRAAE